LNGENLGTKVEIQSAKYAVYQNRFVYPGEALRLVGEAAVALGDNFSLGVRAGYLMGDPWETPFATLTQEGGANREAGVRTSFIPLSLTLRGRIPVGRFSFDFGAGPSVGILAKSTATDHQWGSMMPDRYWEIEGTYTTAWGFHGVIGAEFRITSWLAIRAEARAEQLTLRPKTATIVKYTVDGVDQLLAAYPNVADREVIYVTDLSDYLNSPIDPNAPSQQLAYNISADTVGGFIGIVLSIP
jgi:hypothetical protein